jgi:hypothetical protein
MIGAIQTFGALVHFHPHIHALVSEGIFLPEGTFVPLPKLATEPFLKLWEQEVFKLLLIEGKITDEIVANIRSWQHSGFSVDQSVRGEGKVIYKTGGNRLGRFPEAASEDLQAGSKRNSQVFDPLDFLAEVTQHIPDPGEHLIRYYGFYSNKSRGLKTKKQGKAASPAARNPVAAPSAKEARKRWAALIKQVYEIDPLVCPRCFGQMKIIAFIEGDQTEVIEKILRHCGLWEQAPARAPPSETAAVG